MANQLLAISAPMIAIIVASVVGLFLVLYGFLRKFSRMGWWGYQILILFACTLLLGKLPLQSLSPILSFAIVAGGFLVAAGLLLGLGALLRRAFVNRREKFLLGEKSKDEDSFVLRLFDGLLGIITAAVNFVALILTIVAPIAVVLSYTGVLPGVFAIITSFSVGTMNIWSNFVLPFAFDFLLIGFLLLFIKGGYRLGLLRSVWTVIMLLLGVGAFVGAIFTAMKMPGVCLLSQSLIGSFAAKGMNALVASFLGYGIVTLIAFFVYLLVLILLNLLVNLGVRAVDRFVVLRVIDGVIIATVFFALGLAVVCGLNFVIFQATNGAFGEMMQGIATKLPLETIVRSSALSRFFFDNNLILAFFG